MSVSSFSTTELRTWRDPQPRNFKSFTTNYPASSFPIGLSTIDTKVGTNPRVRAYVDNVAPADSTFQNFKADFHLDTWLDTRLYCASCTWFDVSKHSTDFQFGSFDTSQLSRGAGAVLDIQFNRWHYDIPPKVVVWLSALDIEHAQNPRIFVTATNVTSFGFTLGVGTWSDTRVNGSAVHWIAVPSDRSNMTAGDFAAAFDGERSAIRTRIVFDRPFKRPPRVLVALNRIHAGNRAGLRIATAAEDVTREGVTLAISTWADSILYGAGVSYLAIEEPGEYHWDIGAPLVQGVSNLTAIAGNQIAN